jgi:hypothetical protein
VFDISLYVVTVFLEKQTSFLKFFILMFWVQNLDLRFWVSPSPNIGLMCDKILFVALVENLTVHESRKEEETKKIDLRQSKFCF